MSLTSSTNCSNLLVSSKTESLTAGSDVSFFSKDSRRWMAAFQRVAAKVKAGYLLMCYTTRLSRF